MQPTRILTLAVSGIGLCLAGCATPGKPTPDGGSASPERGALPTGLVKAVTDSQADQMAPAWSSDGQSLLYQSNGDGNWELYYVNLPDGRAVRLTDSPEAEEDPSWSADGAWLVCTVHAPSLDADAPREILLMDRSGKQRRVLAASGSDDWFPRFDPTGKSVYFISDRVDGRKEVPDADRKCALFRVDLADGQVTQLTEAGRFTGPVPAEGRVLLADGTHGYAWWSEAGVAPVWQDSTRHLGQADWHPVRGWAVAQLQPETGSRLLMRGETDTDWRELPLEGREAEQSPSFRPDGGAMAFAGRVGGQWDIFVREFVVTANPGRR